MSGLRSRNKGKRGEREVAELLRESGFDDARRGVQFRGGPDSPDVVGLPGHHIEVKYVERFSLFDALEQADSEAPEGAVPVVFHRRNGKPWVVVLRAREWLSAVCESIPSEDDEGT